MHLLAAWASFSDAASLSSVSIVAAKALTAVVVWCKVNPNFHFSPSTISS
ncbi:MAG: hypothetical protein ACOX3B_01685 [Bacilli bacterium]